MNWRQALFVTCLIGSVPLARADDRTGVTNPSIDMEAHLRLSNEAARQREERRLSEAEFVRLSREPGTVVLDARSKQKYDELHIRGAVNLDFSDIAIESLKQIIPDKNSRVLIYCNNNFRNAEGPFPTKLAPASLNLSTYITLYIYGYRNVYELGPLVDLQTTKLELEPTR